MIMKIIVMTMMIGIKFRQVIANHSERFLQNGYIHINMCVVYSLVHNIYYYTGR